MFAEEIRSEDLNNIPSPVDVFGEKSSSGVKVAILPFENLSNRFLAIDDVMKVFYQNFKKKFTLSSYEEVDEVILRLRLRHTGFLSSYEASEIGRRLRVEAIVLGMICIYQETPEPKIGLIIKIIGTGDGTPILWMKSAITGGSQGQTWFGRNSVTKTSKLLDGVVKDLIREIPIDALRKDDKQ